MPLTRRQTLSAASRRGSQIDYFLNVIFLNRYWPVISRIAG